MPTMENPFKSGKIRHYWDTAAATPMDSRVKKVMFEKMAEFGNPASIHQEGVAAEKIIATAREKIAKILFCQPDEIVFTGSGTEGDNLALLGAALAWGKKPGHIITTQIEHKAVLAPCERLAREGFDVTYLPVDKEGLINPADLAAALRPETFLVSIVYANNEIGSIQPIKEIAKVLRQWRKKQIAGDYLPEKLSAPCPPYLHLDACQAPRFLNLNVAQLGVDLMTLNGSKIYGPKGVGLLYVRREVKLQPVVLGGGQENGLRSGTQNAPAIAGLARALEICEAEREKESVALLKVRDFLAEELKKISSVHLNGGLEKDKRLPNNLNFSVKGLEGEQLVLEFDARGFALSAGSACSYNNDNGSHVVSALGFDQSRQIGATRISLPRGVKIAEAKKFVAELKGIIKKYN